MTNANAPESRLDRLEALAETLLLAVQQQSDQIRQQGDQIRQQGDQIRQQGDQIRQQGDQIRQQGESIQQCSADLRVSIAEVVEMISDLAQQQAETDVRFQNLLEDARSDRRRIDEALARWDREQAIHEMEHRAFRETFQTLLAEVSRIWQRLA
jgi:chromosome segregation ATPase